jgi:hypothetical protein
VQVAGIEGIISKCEEKKASHNKVYTWMICYISSNRRSLSLLKTPFDGELSHYINKTPQEPIASIFGFNAVLMHKHKDSAYSLIF